MKCVHTFGTGRHKRKADITLLFQYILNQLYTFQDTGKLPLVEVRKTAKIRKRYSRPTALNQRRGDVMLIRRSYDVMCLTSPRC